MLFSWFHFAKVWQLFFNVGFTAVDDIGVMNQRVHSHQMFVSFQKITILFGAIVSNTSGASVNSPVVGDRWGAGVLLHTEELAATAVLVKDVERDGGVTCGGGDILEHQRREVDVLKAQINHWLPFVRAGHDGDEWATVDFVGVSLYNFYSVKF